MDNSGVHMNLENVVTIDNMWSSVERLADVVLSAVLFYILIVAMVRISGKRTTGELNNFDWIITVAVGSLAASGILLRDVSTLDASAAILALGALQYLTTRWVRQSDLASRIFKAEPTLLTHRGEFLEDAMARTRISREEILGALRANGCLKLDDANWVVLETNGQLSVIPKSDRTYEEVDTVSDVPAPDKVE